MKSVSLASLLQHVTMHTCLIRYIRHVGGIMFDCFFIMFQCCFKVLILIRRVPQFFFLQGLLGNKRGIRGFKKLNLTKWLRTHWKCTQDKLTFLLFSGRSSSLGGGGWVSLGLGGGGGVGSSSSSISERFSPSSTDSVVITLGSCSFLWKRINKCISNVTVLGTTARFPN